jgi:glycerol 3-phosphatase-2
MVSRLVDRFDAFLIDLDGVVMLGDDAVPGAPQALAGIRKRGKEVVFITNDPRGAIVDHQARLARAGIVADVSEILTAAAATAAYIAQHRTSGDRSAFVVGSKALKAEIRDIGLTIIGGDAGTSADIVVVGLHTDFDYAELRIAALAVRRGAAFFATSADPTFPMPDGLWPGTGAVVAAIETAADREATVVGKPEAPMFETALSLIQGKRPVVIGDTVTSDIAGGRRAGLPTILISPKPLTTLPPKETPDFVVPSLLAVVEA